METLEVAEKEICRRELMSIFQEREEMPRDQGSPAPLSDDEKCDRLMLLLLSGL